MIRKYNRLGAPSLPASTLPAQPPHIAQPQVSLPQVLLTSSAAGIISAAVMSVAMNVMFHLLPAWQQYALPPRQITRVLTRRVGAGELVETGRREWAAAALGHLGYSVFSAFLYTLSLAPIRSHPLVKGLLGGLLLYTGSYQGWIPALRVLPPAVQQPPQRVALMVLAHLIWGSVTALTVDRMLRWTRRGG